jgi:DNA-binding transcriptional regulator YdaS (Cro superfamily)
MSSGMALIRARRGLLAQVAHGLGVTRAAVVKWRDVPAERVVEIERITGIPREQLRPDLYAPRSRHEKPPVECAA